MGSLYDANNDRTVGAIDRFHTDGSLDESFGDEGLVTFDTGDGGEASFNQAVVQSDGSIVVAGLGVFEEIGTYFLVRLTSTGEFDAEFGEEPGIAYVDANSETGSQYLLLQPDDSILIGDGGGFWLQHFSSEGERDVDFGDGGEANAEFPGAYFASMRDIAVQPDGKILVAGGVAYESGGVFSSEPARSLPCRWQPRYVFQRRWHHCRRSGPEWRS